MVEIVLLILLLVVAVFLMSTKKTLQDKLAANGWTLYVLPGCKFCTMQEQLLPGYRKKIECSRGCPGIKGYPTWKNFKTGEEIAGYQDMHKLRKMAE